MFDELTEKNLLLYAARHYHNPLGASSEEFEEDLKKFKYIKRLVNRYLETNELAERLIMNHLIVVFNVFGIEAGVKILGLKLEGRHWPVIKPFLVYLKYLQSDEFTNITMDENVVSILRKEFR
tara:strand:+ start:131 stop:499 length:369 start_codon:yes stop_codon:yes gene_type:complete